MLFVACHNSSVGCYRHPAVTLIMETSIPEHVKLSDNYSSDVCSHVRVCVRVCGREGICVRKRTFKVYHVVVSKLYNRFANVNEDT